MKKDSETVIPLGSLKEIFFYNKRYKFAAMALILFLCSAILDSFWYRVMPDFEDKWYIINFVENVMLGIPILLCYLLIPRKQKLRVWPIYLAAVIVLAGSVLIYPEYKEWFSHSDWGIYNRFLLLKRGFYALLIVGLFLDARKLLNCMMLSAKLCFVFYLMQFMMASIRGYWPGITATGEQVNSQYNLVFGYDMVFCVLAFLCLFIYHRKMRYAAAASIGFMTIVVAGSRGSLACVIAAVIFLIIEKWRRMEKKSFKFMAANLIIIFTFLFLLIEWQAIIDGLLNLLRKSDIQSRSIELLLQGNLFADNGRSEITDMALGLIRDGGLFGHGVYGDRYVIGRTYYWGYSHNIFLEIYVSFGILGGTIIIGVLAYYMVKMLVLCKEPVWKVLYMICACSCVRLLFSDSYWYNTFFWSLIGILGLWNKQYRKRKQGNSNGGK